MLNYDPAERDHLLAPLASENPSCLDSLWCQHVAPLTTLLTMPTPDITNRPQHFLMSLGTAAQTSIRHSGRPYQSSALGTKEQ